jgi:hypothetical protein
MKPKKYQIAKSNTVLISISAIVIIVSCSSILYSDFKGVNLGQKSLFLYTLNLIAIIMALVLIRISSLHLELMKEITHLEERIEALEKK